MKKIPVIFFFLSLSASAQVQTDFESGDLTAWESFPVGRWEISYNEPVAGLGSLHHGFNNPDSGTDGLSIFMGHLMPDSSNVTWKFRVRHAYPPSSSNNWGVFLAADQGAENMVSMQDLRGFILGVNIQGYDDLLKLWYVEKKTITEIITTSLNWQEEIGTLAAPAIQVEYTSSGKWEIMVDSAGSFSTLKTIGTGSYTLSAMWDFFGLIYSYSSAQDRKWWMDDLSISGHFVKDSLAPYIDTIKVCNEKLIRLSFSERMDHRGATKPENYLLNHCCPPDSVKFSGDYDYSLYFPGTFVQDYTNTLKISGVADLSGNPVVSAPAQFVYHRPMFQDVVINEIMADPEPPVLLPSFEYVELFNRSDFPINLEGWSLTAGNDRVVLPGIRIDPGKFILLAGEAAALHPAYSHMTLGIQSFPQLNNEGEEIYLCSGDGRLISYVSYSPEWFREEYQREGGWSLERIDPDNPCDACGNWTGSMEYRGGTPGQQNSVLNSNPDTRSPTALRMKVNSPLSLELVFSEPMDTIRAGQADCYFIDHEVGYPISVRPVFPDYKRVILELAVPLNPFTEYFLQLSTNLTDCAGNSVKESAGIRLALPENILPGELVINEILFNPYPDEFDYLEVVNRSAKVFDLSSLYLARGGGSQGEIIELCPVPVSGLIFPGDYVLFTSGPEVVMSRYFTNNADVFIVPECLPAMPDKEGYILLVNRELQVVDELSYDEEMHFPLIKNREGVSLERIHFDRPSADPTNWHSASETSGFGTPGTVNSQYSEYPVTGADIVLEPEIFSPDNDGYNDLLHLNYLMDHPGFVANVTIFDSRGREIKRLARNQLLGRDGIISWDGMMENGAPAPEGIYLFFTEVFDLNGRARRYKNTCVLARRK